ncbi:MAG: AtpZ/AtpI family protein [Pseudomonadota bacterium]
MTGRGVDDPPREDDDPTARDIEKAAARQERARRSATDSPLRGFAVFGMVGWSIAVPTVAGALLGLWLDRVLPQTFSWTLTLLIGGAILGAAIAWRWVARER